MEAAYCRTTGSEFYPTLREFDADPDIDGLLVVVTPDNAFTPAAVVRRLGSFRLSSGARYLGADCDRELAAPGQTANTIGALTIGKVANNGRGHLERYNKTAVAGAIDGL